MTWAFEFEDQPFFAGFRSLATNGIDKPVLNVFRMFNKMSGRRVAVQSDGAVPLDDILRHGVRGKPDVSAMASLDTDRLYVLVWHYHDDDVPGPAAEVSLDLEGLPLENGSARLEHYRVDDRHSNAYTLWKRMGLSAAPTPEEYAELEKAGQLAMLNQPSTSQIHEGKATVHFTLPRQAVSLLVLDWRSK